MTTTKATTSTATAPRKFMFETSFEGNAAANRPPERKPVTLKPDDYDALKKESFDQGFAEGTRVTQEGQGRVIAALLEKLGESIDHLVTELHTQKNQRDSDLRQSVMAIAKKLLPSTLAENGMQEMQKLIADTIIEMAHEPRLVVRTSEHDFETLNAYVTEIANKRAYAGKLIVVSDEAIVAGDCRIEWADGGIERNVNDTWEKISDVVTPNTPSSPHQE